MGATRIILRSAEARIGFAKYGRSFQVRAHLKINNDRLPALLSPCEILLLITRICDCMPEIRMATPTCLKLIADTRIAMSSTTEDTLETKNSYYIALQHYLI